MKKAYKLDFQKIRRKTQVKDFVSFELYLKNIFSEIAKKEINGKDQKGIDKISFIEYMNIPFIVGEKLFNSLDKSQKGHLTKGEFVQGIINLYVGDLEETQKTIFNILDFDRDGIIIPEDSRLLISFIKNLSKTPANVIKQKLQSRDTINDEENLEEIDELINNFFNKKSYMTFEEYRYNIEKLNSDVFFVFIYFLYNNRPFNDSSIKVLKLLSSPAYLTSSFSSSANSSCDDGTAETVRSRVKSPSNTFKSFIYDLVDVDVEEIEKECVDDENEGSENIEEYPELLNEERIEIKIPEFNSKLDITEKKSNKDYPCPNTSCGNKKLFNNDPLKNSSNNAKTLMTLNDKKCNINENLNNSIKVSKSAFFKDKNNVTLTKEKSFYKKFSEVNNEEILINNMNINTANKNNLGESLISTNDGSNFSQKKDIVSNKLMMSNKKEFLIEKQSMKNQIKILKTITDESNFSIDKNSQENQKLKRNNTDNNENVFIYNIDKINDDENFLKNSKQKKVNTVNNLGFESPKASNKNEQIADDLINPADITKEGYIFKSRSNSKLKKYYLVLIGMDLFYFSNSKKTKLKGMHNLSGSYITQEGDLIKVRKEAKNNKKISKDETANTLNYYPFILHLKKKSRLYYCQRKEECQNWIRIIREITKFRDVNDFYDLGESLGKGKFGNVKLGLNKETGLKTAVKVINKTVLKGIETEMVKTEIEIMKFCRHQNIVKLIDNFEDLENIYIVLEYLTGGNLNYFLSQQQTILPETKIKEIIYQIGIGIEYLHHFGILHRDLKPENLMMSDKNHKNAIVKIVDFGLSKILGVTEKSNDAYGTLSYAAPEVIQKFNYTNTIDIWSMGIILFFLVCGYLPFNDKNNNVNKIAHDITKASVKIDPNIWDTLSPNAKDLTLKCLEKDKEKRLNIKEFLEHDWFLEN